MDGNTEKRILCFGDSNTYGFDPCSWAGGRYGPEARWPELLGKALQCEVINCGMNGRTIPRTGTETQWELAALRQKLPCSQLLVMLGTNDLLEEPMPAAETAAARMENFLQALQQMEPKAEILLLAPPLIRDYGQERETASRELAVRYREITVRMGVRFADTAAWNLPLSYDGLHLTEEGQQKMARQLALMLKELF